MIEHVARGEVQVHPRVDGGRHILVFASDSDIFRIPLLDQQSVDVLVQELSLSDEDLNAEIERRAARARIAMAQSLPQQNGDGGPPCPN